MNTAAKAVQIADVQALLRNLANTTTVAHLKHVAVDMIQQLEDEKKQYAERSKIALLDVFAQSNIKPPEEKTNSLKVYCMNCGEVNEVYPYFIPSFHCTCCHFENRLTKEQIKYLKSL
jgi:predicted trehalose synthase